MTSGGMGGSHSNQPAPQQTANPPPQRRRAPPKVIISGSSRARSKGFNNKAGNAAMNIPSHQRPAPSSFNTFSNSTSNNNDFASTHHHSLGSKARSGGNSGKSRRDEVWEQKRQERLMRKQQGGGSAGRGSGIASNLQRQQPPAIGTQQTYTFSDDGVCSIARYGRQTTSASANVCATIRTSPKSGRGIW